MPTSCKASAPGSLMLMGEHAVLRDKLALATAINKKITVTLKIRNDRSVTIRSTLGTLSFSLDDIPEDPRFSFVLESIRLLAPQLPSGFDLYIESEFLHTLGLGSSSAVTAATCAVLSRQIDYTIDPYALFSLGLKVIRTVQGQGSGTDLAASIFGGIVAYKQNPLTIIPIGKTFPLSVIYSGAKLPTKEVIKIVQERELLFPDLYSSLFDLMDMTTQKTQGALEAGDVALAGKLFTIYQGLMDALGVNNKALSNIIYALRDQDGIFGAKISGSGLGDCAIALGKATHIPEGFQKIDVNMDKTGLLVQHTIG